MTKGQRGKANDEFRNPNDESMTKAQIPPAIICGSIGYRESLCLSQQLFWSMAKIWQD